MIVFFKDVGRLKKSWTSQIVDLTPEALEHEIRKNGAILARCIDFDLFDDEIKGQILVGGIRPVGTFEVIHQALGWATTN